MAHLFTDFKPERLITGYYEALARLRTTQAWSAAAFFVTLLSGAHVISTYVAQSVPTALTLVARQSEGIPGIALSPLTHDSFEHLIPNALLGAVFLFFYVRQDGLARLFALSPLLWLTPQVVAWLVLSPGVVVIGASGVVCSLTGLLVVNSVRVRDYLAMCVSGLYAMISLVQSVTQSTWLTGGQHISWPSHLGGIATGVIVGLGLWLFLYVRSPRHARD